MASQAYEAAGGRWTVRRKLSAALWRRPRLRAVALLLPPLGWMFVFYLAALAVLLVSAELDEILTLSDRIGVLYRGELVGQFERAAATRDEVGLLMASGRQASGMDQP